MVCYSVSHMAVSIGEVMDGICFEHSVFSKIHARIRNLLNMSLIPLVPSLRETAVTVAARAVANRHTDYCNPAQRVNHYQRFV